MVPKVSFRADYHRFHTSSELFGQKCDSLHDVRIFVPFSNFGQLLSDSYLSAKDNNIIITEQHPHNCCSPTFFQSSWKINIPLALIDEIYFLCRFVISATYYIILEDLWVVVPQKRDLISVPTALLNISNSLGTRSFSKPLALSSMGPTSLSPLPCGSRRNNGRFLRWLRLSRFSCDCIAAGTCREGLSCQRARIVAVRMPHEDYPPRISSLSAWMRMRCAVYKVR